jgi:hypothetical protein
MYTLVKYWNLGLLYTHVIPLFEKKVKFKEYVME